MNTTPTQQTQQPPHSSPAKRLLLVGCGHAHVFVLEKLAQHAWHTREGAANIQITLITPSPILYYSGILPSVLAGHISFDDLSIDVAPLAHAAQVTLVWDKATHINTSTQQVTTEQHGEFDYDWLSINTGAAPKQPWHGQHIAGVKPIAQFLDAWKSLKQSAQLRPNHPPSIAIVGGGAAAVEIAFATQHAFPQASVTIVSPQLLKDQPQKAQRLVHKGLAKAHITHLARRVTQPCELDATHVFVAMGASAPLWLQDTGLALCDNGFIQVNAYHQSTSHPNVFATGDVCTRSDILLPKAGVYAVRAGDVLADNILHLVSSHGSSQPLGNLTPYRPRKHVLQLFATGKRYAIAVYGRWVVSGQWVWYWKRAIDIRFIKRFNSTHDG